jgi:hypothetical protein
MSKFTPVTLSSNFMMGTLAFEMICRDKRDVRRQCVIKFWFICDDATCMLGRQRSAPSPYACRDFRTKKGTPTKKAAGVDAPGSKEQFAPKRALADLDVLGDVLAHKARGHGLQGRPDVATVGVHDH